MSLPPATALHRKPRGRAARRRRALQPRRRAIEARLAWWWRAVRRIEPQFREKLSVELSSRQPWRDRAVILGFAACTGLFIVAFSVLAEAAIFAFRWLGTATPAGGWIALLWTPVVTVAVLAVVRRHAPAAAGSGIPQVVRALQGDLSERQAGALVSFRLSVIKALTLCAGLLGGLSIGREGPAVQIGAGVMAGARRWLSPAAGIDRHDLMVAGAAAGIAAAFNTPLGGIVFALEQLTRRRGMEHRTVLIAAIVLSGLVGLAFFGNETYFGRLRLHDLSWNLLLPGLGVAVVSGLAGGLFSRLLVLSLQGTRGPLNLWRGSHPLKFAAVCALLVAVMGLATDGATAGAGYKTTRALLDGELELPGVYTLLKFLATWLSAWSGVPAGVFAPSLAVGAGIGRDVALLAGVTGDAAIPLIALGMAGFLAAVTAGPITAFIIVMEMVSGQSMLLPLMACAIVASSVSRLMAGSLYDELAAALPVPGEAPARRPTEP